MKSLIFLFLIPSLCHAEYKLNPYTNQKDFYESTAAVAKSTGALTDRVYALEQSGVGGSTIAVNSSQFIGNGGSGSPLTLLSSSVTLQGNSISISSFKGRIDNLDVTTATLTTSKLSNTATVPADLIDLSTVTAALAGKLDYPVTGLVSLGTYGLTTSSDVVAHAYYGDGSHLTGVSTSGGSTSTAAYDGAPIGTFINYGSTIPPAGYLYCDGTNYSTTTYRDLFNVIGYKYSGFAISSGPVFTCDFRGMFSRGVDETKLRDSEYRVVGSTEVDKSQGHKHWALDPSGGAVQSMGAGGGSTFFVDAYNTEANGFKKTGSPINDGTNGEPRTGPETRPMNVAVAVMVKYGNPMVVNVSTFAISNTPNTFTGANTFTGSVTASSLTVTSPTGLTISTFSATANGFTYLPGGLLLQWGNVSIGANTTTTFSFPKVFPTACFSMTATHGTQGAWQGYNAYVSGPGGVNIVSTSQFQISNLDDFTITYYWQAIGN